MHSRNRPHRLSVICFFLSVAVFTAHAQNKKPISISGTVLMRDDVTPHLAIVVQAVIPTPLPRPGRGGGGEGESEPTIVSTVLSNDRGEYELTALPPGGL
ncbi:hypothetical protein HYR99_40580 [Candidatus Poribacteria bacterium]|nr:hypothetical protein [Candidatus Poribacteria bacterium]